MAHNLPLTLIVAALATNGTAQLEWTGYYIGADADHFASIAHAGAGYTYAAGYTVNANGDRDILVSYFDAAGGTIWNFTWNGAANGDDQAFDLAATDVGNVVVVGKTYVGPPDDYAGVMLYITGATGTVWCSQEVNLAPGYPDVLCQVVIPAVGDDIFAAGYSQSTSDLLSRQILLARWDQDCNEAYALNYAHGYRADGFAVDNNYNAYVASSQDLGGDENIVTSRIGPSGVTDWIEVADGLGFADGANDLELDVLSNVYVTGFQSTSAAPGSKDMFTVKYDALGNFGWDASFDLGGDDEGVDVEDAFGFPVVAGTTQGSGGTGRDGVLVKYDNLGSLFWKAHYNGPQDDDVNDLAGPASNGDFAIVGQLSNTALGFGIWTVGGAGSTIWSNVYSGTGDEAIARRATYLFDDCIAVAGHVRTGTSEASADAVVRKYCVTVGEQEPSMTASAGARPNPFNDALWIDLPLPKGLAVEVEVFDPSGRIHHRGSMITGEPIDLGALADGTYLVRWRTTGASGRVRVMKGI